MSDDHIDPAAFDAAPVAGPLAEDAAAPIFTGDHAGLSRAADELAANREKASADAGDGAAAVSTPIAEDPVPGTPLADATESAESDAEAARVRDDHARLKQALQTPQVRKAIAEEFGKAETIRREYAKALDVASVLLRESLTAQFPELKCETAEQFQAALAKLAEQDPARYVSARALTDRLGAVHASQQLEQQQRQQAQQSAFGEYAKAEDARFDAMLKDEKPETVQKVATEIVAYAEELGVPREQFLQLCRTEPVMRNAAFQKMMYDAASYRLLQRARDEITRKAVPPVQRPGVPVDAKGDAREGELKALNTRFVTNPSIKAAADVIAARRKSGTVSDGSLI